MDMEISEHFIHKLKHLDRDSRVWIYQSPEPLQTSMVIRSRELLNGFLSEWNAHGKSLSADAAILFDRFIVFAADESKVKASGCSIDQSVKLIRELSNVTGQDFFDRQTIAYLEGETIRTIPLNSLAEAIDKGIIIDATMVFDNLIDRLDKLRNDWIKPLSSSWMKSFTGHKV